MTRDELLGTIFGVQAMLLCVKLIEPRGVEFLAAPDGFAMYLVRRYRMRWLARQRRERIWHGSAYRPVRSAPAGL